MTTYLTVVEAAERLRVSKWTVTRLVDEGRLPASDLNAGRGKKQRKLVFRETDLEKFVERGAIARKPSQPSRRRRSQQQELPEKEYV